MRVALQSPTIAATTSITGPLSTKNAQARQFAGQEPDPNQNTAADIIPCLPRSQQRASDSGSGCTADVTGSVENICAPGYRSLLTLACSGPKPLRSRTRQDSNCNSVSCHRARIVASHPNHNPQFQPNKPLLASFVHELCLTGAVKGIIPSRHVPRSSSR